MLSLNCDSVNYKTQKEIKRRRYQLKRMRRTMKRQSKSYKLRRRHRLENRRRGLVAQREWERKAYVELEVPKNFSFIDNTNEILEYFIKCKSLLHNKEKVQCDLSHITALSSDAIALLAACANDESFLGKRGRIRGNAPADPELLRLFIESGFYNHVKATKVLKSAHKSDTNLFHQESNYQVQSDIAKNACILGTKHVFGSNKPFPDLYEMLIEAMSNTNNHASNNSNANQFKWWLYTYNAPNGHTMYTFIDLGVGIFDSIPVQLFKKIKKVIGLENNTDLVPDLLDGKIITQMDIGGIVVIVDEVGIPGYRKREVATLGEIISYGTFQYMDIAPAPEIHIVFRSAEIVGQCNRESFDAIADVEVELFVGVAPIGKRGEGGTAPHTHGKSGNVERNSRLYRRSVEK